MLGFNDTSNLVSNLVSSPREERKEIKEIKEIVEEKERDREERETGMKSEETEEINIPPLPLPAIRIAGLAQL